MEINRAAELLRALADGIDPMTGQPLPDESVYNRRRSSGHCTASCRNCRSGQTALPLSTRAGTGAQKKKHSCCRNTAWGFRSRRLRAATGGASAPIETRLSELGQRDQIQFSMR